MAIVNSYVSHYQRVVDISGYQNQLKPRLREAGRASPASLCASARSRVTFLPREKNMAHDPQSTWMARVVLQSWHWEISHLNFRCSFVVGISRLEMFDGQSVPHVLTIPK